MEGTRKNLGLLDADGRRANRQPRGQAAIFDGINLLLLAAISAALIFSFVSSYGTQQDRVLRSAYILNYMQSVVKASYYIDASTLRNIDNHESTVNSLGNPTTVPLETYQDLVGPDGCEGLRRYSGSFSVTELLKRDLAESNPKLDDQFDGTASAGITAYKCAVKELMKPFWYSGFYYGFDVIDMNTQDGVAVQVMPKNSGTNANSRLITDYPKFLKNGPQTQFGICAKAKDISPDVVTVQVPFKVIYVDTSVSPPKRELRSYTLAFCIWHPDPNAT